MIAKTQLPNRLLKLHDKVWPFTRYEANSRTRHWEYPWVMSQIQDYIRKNKITSYKELSIIDVGAASSCLQFYYAKKKVDYTCIDPSQKSFDPAITRSLKVKVNYAISPFEKFKTDKKYDLVLFVSVMEHTKRENEKQILSKTSEVLKTYGRAIFTLDWFFDYKIGQSCRWGHNPNCKKLISQAEKQGLKLILGDKQYLSGFNEFNEKEIKKDAFVLKVCNKGVWLTSLAFVLEKVK